jgi:hypothetical protein
VVVILACEQLVDARQLGNSYFFAVLALAAAYAAVGIVLALRPSMVPGARTLMRLGTPRARSTRGSA